MEWVGELYARAKSCVTLYSMGLTQHRFGVENVEAVVNLHPVSIILAVLFFGGLWGFWGVFFAIPLATLIKALVQAWPRGESGQAEIEKTP